MKEEIVYLKRIIEIIQDLENYLGDDDFLSFVGNKMKLDAIIMKLQVLGENMKKIKKYENISQKEIIGLRDWISHDYFGLDLEIIFNTIKFDIPDLKNKIQEIILNK